MFDMVKIDETVLDSLMIAITALGVLLLVGVVLRMVVPLFRRYFIPASLIGGLIGLALGPNGAGVFSPEINSTWAAIPGLLIAVVFAPMLMGQELPSVKESARTAAPHIFYSYFSSFAVIAVPALLTFVLFQPLFGVNQMFSTIFEVSWPGGHGTAAGMAPAYEALGWANGSSLALGSATAGLLFGIVGGMIMINVAARKGYLTTVPKQQGPQPVQSDILPESKQVTHSVGRLNGSSLDNLAFHVALIGLAMLMGWVMKYFVDMVLTGVPLFPLAMIGGLLLHLAIGRTRLKPLVDKKTLDSISGIALDFLVVAAVASISIPVILENWIPLSITLVIMAAMSLVIFYVVSPRVFKKDWFVHGIINFGTMTGVASVGLLLMRAADPKLETDAGRAYALRAPFVSPFIGGGLITAMFPILAVQYGNLWLGLGSVVMCVAMYILARTLGIWSRPAQGAHPATVDETPARQ